MKHPHRWRYAVTFLASIALTFHFLQSRSPTTSHTKSSSGQSERESYAQTLLHRRPQGYHEIITKPGFQVLPGNITVHVGEKTVRTTKDWSYIFDAELLCNDFRLHDRKLVIFVASKVANFERRQAIRDTWGLRSLQQALNFRIAFILGESESDYDQHVVETESNRYGDIVQINITESFQKLGEKTIVGLNWSKKHCSKSDFVMKADDDILVHVPNLLAALKTAAKPETLLLCHENRMRKILRKELLNLAPKNYKKYEVSENDVPGTYYPPYCSGMGYVFSRKVRDQLLWASTVTPVFFIEDVYLTGFCRYKAGVQITANSDITLRPPVSKAQAACAFQDGRITSQEVGVTELQEMWAEMNTKGFFCPELIGTVQRPSINPDLNASPQRRLPQRNSLKRMVVQVK